MEGQVWRIAAGALSNRGVLAMRAVAVALVLAAAVPAAAADLEVSSSIDMVTVYPDGATVTRILKADLSSGDTTLIARDFPPTLDPASLRVEGEGTGRITIGSIDARPPRAERPPSHPELERRLEALRDERAVIVDAIAAAAARKQFVERFATSVPFGLGEKGEARPLAEWRQAFLAVSEEIAAADAILREARLKQRGVDREIARVESELKGNPARKMEVRIDLAADAPGAATFRVSYTVRGARWAPIYDARLDSGTRERKPVIELVRRAEIVQRTGEDWDNVALAVSTVRTAKGGSTPELRPLIVRFLEARRDQTAGGGAPPPAAAPSPRKAKRTMVPMPTAPAPAQEQEAVAETGGFQVLFRVPGRVSVSAQEGAKSLRLTAATIEPELLVRAAPVLDETGFLEASFKHTEEAPLLPGRVSIYRDGVFVGRGAMPATPKDETVRLGFGADEQVKVKRVLVRKNESQTGIITSAKVDEREFKITVRNGHARPLRVEIEDQIPVSEIQDVVVEMLPVSTPPTAKDARDRRGVVAWNFELKPGETRELKLAWRVRWPADRQVIYGPAAR
jgi:uncharacterized protein (TIGR02231 family)